MFLDGGRREIHLGRDAGDGLVVDPPPQQHRAPQWRKSFKGGGYPGQSLAVRCDPVRQRFTAGIGVQDSVSIARLPAKTIDETVGRDPERQGEKARRLTLDRKSVV